MAVLADRVKETSTTTGGGDFTLDGAASGGYFTFASAFSVGDRVLYCIQNPTMNEAEVGLGTLTSATTLERTTVQQSTNNGDPVNFSAGTKTVFVTDTQAYLEPYTATGDLLYRNSTGLPTALPIGTAGQVLTVASGLPSWASGTPGSAPFPDTTSIVEGSVDPTKEIRFEVDGLTTGTVRVLTPPDADINLPGTNITNTWVLVQTFSSSPTAPFGSGGGCERFGAGAGNSSATGADNVVFGSAAGDALTSGARNIGIGTNAIGAMTTASDNIAIGCPALNVSTITAQYNVAIGNNSCKLLTTATDNIAIGYSTLGNATTAGQNVAIGRLTLDRLIDTNDNVCIGFNVLSQNAGSAQTVAIGTNALFNASNSWNVAIGYTAGSTMTSGSENVIIGAYAGTVLTDGASNVIIGYDAETSATGTNDSVAIGNEAVAASNEFSLGPNVNSINVHVYSSTPTNRKRFSLTAANIDNTDATRKYRLIISVWDTAEREALRFDASGAAANASFFGAGSFGGGAAVIFITNATTDPSSNPTGGGILYSSGGAGKWRGSSGTTSTFGPAGPHCGRCGYDMWRICAVNEIWGARLMECGWCGKIYKKGPVSVLHLLNEEQRAELLTD